MLGRKTTYTISEFLEKLEAKNADLTINKINYRRYLIFVGACLINFNTVYAEQIVISPETLSGALRVSISFTLIIAALRIVVKVFQFIISEKVHDPEEVFLFLKQIGKSIADLVLLYLLPGLMNDVTAFVAPLK